MQFPLNHKDTVLSALAGFTGTTFTALATLLARLFGLLVSFAALLASTLLSTFLIPFFFRRHTIRSFLSVD
jgi:hypothetical protein